MDKYDLVLDLVENPAKYSVEQVDEILSDPEAKEIYNLICKTASSMISETTLPDIEAEWSRFKKHNQHNRVFSRFGNRAASVAAFTITSIAALAIGIALTVSVAKHEQTSTSVTTKVVTSSKESDYIKNDDQPADTISTPAIPIMFEDDSLREIMEVVSKQYAVTVNYENEKTANLHLYFRFDPNLSLDEVIEQLNNFEQININRKDNTLTIR